MLNVKAFALASGILWAMVGLWMTLISLWGFGSALFNLVDQFYFGWMVESYPGALLNTAICFADGLIAGAIFAWIYNAIAKKVTSD